MRLIFESVVSAVNDPRVSVVELRRRVGRWRPWVDALYHIFNTIFSNHPNMHIIQQQTNTFAAALGVPIDDVETEDLFDSSSSDDDDVIPELI